MNRAPGAAARLPETHGRHGRAAKGILALLVLLAGAAAGAYGYLQWRQHARERALREVIARIQARTPLARLWHDGVAGEGASARMLIAFEEIGPDGRPAEVRRFGIEGSVVYVDALVVTFRDGFVEKGDPLRGRSLVLFRRLFGERQKPADGYPLSAREGVPEAYRLGDPVLALFEEGIWNDFWRFANDPDLAASHGIDAAFGEAVYFVPDPRNLYTIEVRHNGAIQVETERRSGTGP